MRKRIEELLERSAKALTLAIEFDKFSPDSKREIVENIFYPIRGSIVEELDRAKNKWIRSLKEKKEE